MKKDEVKVGGFYTAKVSDKLVTVRIDSTNTHGGWNATNTATGKRIRIKSAQRLRGEVKGDKAASKRDAKPDALTAEAKPVKKGKAKQHDGEKKEKRVSALNAAATVLQNAGQPMRAQEMIAAMAEQGLWSSPNGKTPHATLYAAILREIAAKGDGARFRKVERAQFEFAGKGA
jgi:hypothetical protein